MAKEKVSVMLDDEVWPIASKVCKELVAAIGACTLQPRDNSQNSHQH